jgi:hypothetical protein
MADMILRPLFDPVVPTGQNVMAPPRVTDLRKAEIKSTRIDTATYSFTRALVGFAASVFLMTALMVIVSARGS